MNPRVQNAKAIDNYSIQILFTNGETGIFDATEYLNIGIFQELQKPQIFNTVKAVDGTIQWINGADLCPDTVYLDSKKI